MYGHIERCLYINSAAALSTFRTELTNAIATASPPWDAALTVFETRQDLYRERELAAVLTIRDWAQRVGATALYNAAVALLAATETRGLLGARQHPGGTQRSHFGFPSGVFKDWVAPAAWTAIGSPVIHELIPGVWGLRGSDTDYIRSVDLTDTVWDTNNASVNATIIFWWDGTLLANAVLLGCGNAVNGYVVQAGGDPSKLSLTVYGSVTVVSATTMRLGFNIVTFGKAGANCYLVLNGAAAVTGAGAFTIDAGVYTYLGRYAGPTFPWPGYIIEGYHDDGAVDATKWAYQHESVRLQLGVDSW